MENKLDILFYFLPAVLTGKSSNFSEGNET
jgi:hypothetical protein